MQLENRLCSFALSISLSFSLCLSRPTQNNTQKKTHEAEPHKWTLNRPIAHRQIVMKNERQHVQQNETNREREQWKQHTCPNQWTDKQTRDRERDREKKVHSLWHMRLPFLTCTLHIAHSLVNLHGYANTAHGIIYIDQSMSLSLCPLKNFGASQPAIDLAPLNNHKAKMFGQPNRAVARGLSPSLFSVIKTDE